MCGINGIFDPKNTLDSISLRNSCHFMNKELLHRGPDSQKVIIEDKITLGSTRLSIQDLSNNGLMPMDEDQTVITFNGEIYNFKELINEFRLENLTSKTDTEVIIKMYRKYGHECVKYFNGMFSFALWDKNKQTLFCARDRLGIKPFFYTWYKERFYFSSEIKSLLTIGIEKEPNYKIINKYLCDGIYDHSEETFFKNIYQLPAGKYILLNNNKFIISKYWDLSSINENNDFNFNANNNEFNIAKEEFISLLKSSISLRLRSDVPVGVNVSGGVDSTAMLAIIDDSKVDKSKLSTFSYYYNDDRYDEKKYVCDLMKQLKWDTNFTLLDPNEIPYLAEEAMYYQEQPYPGIITIAKHNMIKKNANKATTVLLEGQGGDEIAAGYQHVFGSYILDLKENGFHERAKNEIEQFKKINNLSTVKLNQVLNFDINSLNKTGFSTDGSNYIKRNCLSKDLLNKELIANDFEKPFKSHLLNIQYRDICFTKLPRILRSCDRASMAFSKELRVPLLDHRIVEFAFKIPGNFKISNGVQRNFMREALKPIIQSNLVNKPKKPVVDPQREWLKSVLKHWVTEIIESKKFNERGIFDSKEVIKEYSNYCNHEKNLNSFHIWQWISIEMWFRKFIDN